MEKSYLLQEIDFLLVNEIADFLLPFESHFDRLEASKVPTSNNVLIIYFKIK